MKTRQQVHNIDSWLTKITTIVRTRPCLSLIVPGIHIYIVNNGVSPFVFSRPVNHVSRSADGAFLGNDFSGGNKPGKAAIFLGSRVPLSRAAPRFPLWSRQPLTSPASDILSATHRTKKKTCLFCHSAISQCDQQQFGSFDSSPFFFVVLFVI